MAIERRLPGTLVVLSNPWLKPPKTLSKTGAMAKSTCSVACTKVPTASVLVVIKACLTHRKSSLVTSWGAKMTIKVAKIFARTVAKKRPERRF